MRSDAPVLALTLAALVLAACGGSDDSSNGAGSSSTGGAMDAAAESSAAGGDNPITPPLTGCFVRDRPGSEVRCTDPARPFLFECPIVDLPSADCVQNSLAPTGYYFDCCP